jgi:hypothetical protein
MTSWRSCRDASDSRHESAGAMGPDSAIAAAMITPNADRDLCYQARSLTAAMGRVPPDALKAQ